MGTVFLGAALAAPSAIPGPAAAPPDPAPPLRLEMGPDKVVCGVTAPASAHRTKKSGGHVHGSGKLGLILWFHGGMRSAKREKGLEAHRQLLGFVDADAWVMASPSAYSGRDWLSPGAMSTTEALIDTLLALYPINEDEIRLIGVSDGSLAVIRYGLAGRRKVRGKILVSSLPQLVLPRESLPGRARLAEGRWDFLQGGQDRLFPPDAVVPYLREWERLYSNAHLHYFPEGEHDFSYYAAHAEPLLRELLAPQKPKKGQADTIMPQKNLASPVK